uniref:Uncharacterized protein n=1 Tax=Globodera pallida TaxID=36090 RepID=A0A183CCQ5_GLOPA
MSAEDDPNAGIPVQKQARGLEEIIESRQSYPQSEGDMDTLAERVDELERANESTEASETRYGHTPAFVTPLDGRQGNLDEDRISEDEPEEDDRALYEVNMLSNTLSIGSSLEVFGEESLFAFEDWAERFKDYLSISGKNWTDEEKVTRLKLALKDTPRALFKELQPGQIRTVEDALNALRAKLDSPQRREIAKRTLSLCKQREDETVVQFLRRLSPLVEATNPSLSCDQRKEKVCEEFLDRLKPNMSFLIRLVGLTQAKNLEVVKAQAQELEALLLANKAVRSAITVSGLATWPTPATLGELNSKLQEDEAQTGPSNSNDRKWLGKIKQER